MERAQQRVFEEQAPTAETKAIFDRDQHVLLQAHVLYILSYEYSPLDHG